MVKKAPEKDLKFNRFGYTLPQVKSDDQSKVLGRYRLHQIGKELSLYAPVDRQAFYHSFFAAFFLDWDRKIIVA